MVELLVLRPALSVLLIPKMLILNLLQTYVLDVLEFKFLLEAVAVTIHAQLDRLPLEDNVRHAQAKEH
jgi:hypothetical protein